MPARRGERGVRLLNSALDTIAGEELTQADARNAIRLAPFDNLHGVRVLLDKFAEGLPERRN